MPIRPPTPCRHPGCPALVAAASGYCAQHEHERRNYSREYDQTIRRNDPALAQAKRIRSSVRWQKVEHLHKALYPLCCNPLGLHPNEPRPNEISNHIIRIELRPDLAFTMGNLGPVCSACNGIINGMERRGEDTTRLNWPAECKEFLARERQGGA